MRKTTESSTMIQNNKIIIALERLVNSAIRDDEVAERICVLFNYQSNSPETSKNPMTSTRKSSATLGRMSCAKLERHQDI